MKRASLYATLFILSAWSAEGAEVRLKSEAICTGAIVRLKDVAEVISEDEAEAAALSELQLFPVPAKERERVARRGEVREILTLSDIDVRSLQITGAEKVSVRRSGTLKPAVQQTSLADQTKPAKASAKTKQQPEVTLIPTVVRALPRGAIIRATDLEMRPVSAKQAQLVTPILAEQLIGQETLRALSPGQPLSMDQVQAQRLIHRGDKVALKSVASGVTITTSAKALEDGVQGENLLLELADSREKVLARVTGYQAAEIYASGLKVSGNVASEPKTTK